MRTTNYRHSHCPNRVLLLCLVVATTTLSFTGAQEREISDHAPYAVLDESNRLHIRQVSVDAEHAPQLAGHVVPDEKQGRDLKRKKSKKAKTTKKAKKRKCSKSSKSSKKSRSSSSDDDCKSSSDDLVVPSNLICNGNCTLPTGAMMFVSADLSNAFAGIVAVETEPVNETSRELNQHRATRALRRLQEDAVISIASFSGQAEISDGDNETSLPGHFTYVMDVSGSAYGRNTCGNRLLIECEVESFLELNDRLQQLDNVASIAVLHFGGEAFPHDFGNGNRTYATSPANPEVKDAIEKFLNRRDGGGTNFRAALTKAAEIVEDAKNSSLVNRTAVVFVTDGVPNTNRGITEENIAKFVQLGTEVKVFALGENARCTDQMKEMAQRTGTGDCNPITNATQLTEEIMNNFFSARSLQEVSLTLDTFEMPGIFSPNITDYPSGLLPQNTPVEFSAVAHDISFNLTDYIHRFCVEAFSNYTSDPTASCCLDFTLNQFMKDVIAI